MSSWYGIEEGEICRNCARPATEPHHIVPRGVTRRGRDDGKRNRMPLCRHCHRGFHERRVIILRNRLTDVEEAFALGAAGEEWLSIWYPTERR